MRERKRERVWACSTKRCVSWAEVSRGGAEDGEVAGDSQGGEGGRRGRRAARRGRGKAR